MRTSGPDNWHICNPLGSLELHVGPDELPMTWRHLSHTHWILPADSFDPAGGWSGYPRGRSESTRQRHTRIDRDLYRPIKPKSPNELVLTWIWSVLDVLDLLKGFSCRCGWNGEPSARQILLWFAQNEDNVLPRRKMAATVKYVDLGRGKACPRAGKSIWFISLLPGNKGLCSKSSPNMQQQLQISIAVVCSFDPFILFVK